MKDRNGVTVTLGAKATVLDGANKGCVGTVRDIRPNPLRRSGEWARVSDKELSGDFTFSSWCEPREVAIVEVKP